MTNMMTLTLGVTHTIVKPHQKLGFMRLKNTQYIYNMISLTYVVQKPWKLLNSKNGDKVGVSLLYYGSYKTITEFNETKASALKLQGTSL